MKYLTALGFMLFSLASHGETPQQSGQDAITGKAIRPLAVAAHGNFGEHDIAIPELRE